MICDTCHSDPHNPECPMREEALRKRLALIDQVVGAACTKRHPYTFDESEHGERYCKACALRQDIAETGCVLERDPEKPDIQPLS